MGPQPVLGGERQHLLDPRQRQTRPPVTLVVCSTETRRERGWWRSVGSRSTAASAAASKMPPSPSR
ncbi:MAG: hypothetical protein U0R26_11710 [Solirubrobacterales bacterium]